MRRVIKFCRVNDEYGFLSNFSYHSFRLGMPVRKPNPLINVFWRTSEHYFQAMKFQETNPEYSERIRLVHTPNEAVRLGRDRLVPISPNWEQTKELVMKTAILAKFRQNLDIKRKLIETGDAILVEHRKADSYWGDGGDGSGKNRLGIALMWLRTVLKEQFNG